MFKYIIGFICALLFFLAAPQVFAQDDMGGTGGMSQVTEYDFDDDLVTGDLVRPDGELVGARRKSKVSSLIRVRQHFIPEMLKSVENL
ncbi:MAG: hypothetical protein ABIJ56_22990 [Pseudomonadota bacterium]